MGFTSRKAKRKPALTSKQKKQSLWWKFWGLLIPELLYQIWNKMASKYFKECFTNVQRFKMYSPLSKKTKKTFMNILKIINSIFTEVEKQGVLFPGHCLSGLQGLIANERYAWLS